MRIQAFALGALWLATPSFAAAPHLDLEMTSQEYRVLVQKAQVLESGAASELTFLLAMGARNLDWLEHINSLREPAQKLELSTAGTQGGIPIETPSLSSEAIVMQQYSAWLAATDASVSQTLLSSDATFPDNPSISDADYLTAARQIDKIYQRASRWLLQLPYLDEYATFQKYDVRGYYFLDREVDRDAKLQGWAALADVEKARLKPLLIGQCFNVVENSLEDCDTEFQEAVTAGTVAAYFTRYAPVAKATWDDFFAIPVTRPDVTWSVDDASNFQIPFRDPANAAVSDWLKTNIEDEFKWNGWQLHLNFEDSTDDDMTHVVFEAGTTPHVNELAGSIITMDGNRALNEYSSRWTIRHEYGHVLGFPDCYVEFFDVGQQAMLNYQLDIDNLMCSRRGKFQQRHFDELKRVYFAAPRSISTSTR